MKTTTNVLWEVNNKDGVVQSTPNSFDGLIVLVGDGEVMFFDVSMLKLFFETPIFRDYEMFSVNCCFVVLGIFHFLIKIIRKILVECQNGGGRGQYICL